MTQTVTLVLKVDSKDRVKVDQMGKSVDTLNTKAKRVSSQGLSAMGRGVSTVGKVAGIAAVGGIATMLAGIGALGLAFRGSTALANEQIEAERKVENTIRATGGAAGVTADELKKYAAELQGVTNFGDEATLQGQAMLLTFKNIGEDTFPRATRAMQDMTAFMKGANATGADLSAQAVQLGKALNDPIMGVAALSRVGVQFTEQQKAQIKAMVEANDIAAAQSLILDELESQFGGTAAAVARPATQMRNAWGDLKEVIGGVGRTFQDSLATVAIPVINRFATDLQSIAPFLNTVASSSVKVLSELVGIGSGFVRDMGARMGIDMNTVAQNSGGWGRGIVLQLARGMAQGSVAVVRVINEIGRIVSHWLKPQSPPKILPDIDKWGAETINVWLQSFTSADFSILNTLGDMVAQHLKNINPDMGAEIGLQVASARELVAELVAAAREGVPAAEAIAAFEAQFGKLPETIRDVADAHFGLVKAQDLVLEKQDLLIAAQSGLEAAQQRVIDAQTELKGAQERYAVASENVAAAQDRVADAQERVNDVTKQYDRILTPLRNQLRSLRDDYRAVNDAYDEATEPLNEELDIIRQQQDAIRDAQRIEELRAQAKDEELSAEQRRLAELEIAEIELQNKIDEQNRKRREALEPIEDAIEAKEREIERTQRAQEAAVAAARLQVEEAQKQVELAQQAADMVQKQVEGAQLHVERMQQGVDAAQKQVDLAQEQVNKANEAVMKAQEELQVRSNIVQEQQKQRDLITEAIDALEALKEGGTGTGVAALIPENFGEQLQQDVLNPMSDMSEEMDQLMADIEAEFAPLRDEMTKTADIFGGLFSGENRVIARVSNLKERGVELIGELRQRWDDDWLGIKTATTESFDAIKLSGQAFRDLFSGDWQGFLSGMTEATEIGLGAIGDVFGKLWSTANTHMSEFWTEFDSWWSSQDWEQLGYNAVTWIIEKLGDMTRWNLEIKAWLLNLVSEMVEEARSADWKEIGNEMIEAIVRSYQFNTRIKETIWALVRGAWDAAVDAITNPFGSGSNGSSSSGTSQGASRRRPATNFTGTDFFSGNQLSWVGEHGPELIAPAGGTRIFNNDTSERIAAVMAGMGAGVRPIDSIGINRPSDATVELHVHNLHVGSVADLPLVEDGLVNAANGVNARLRRRGN